MQRLLFFLCLTLSLSVKAMDFRVIERPYGKNSVALSCRAGYKQLSSKSLMETSRLGSLYYTPNLVCGYVDGHPVDYVGRKIIAFSVRFKENPFDTMSKVQKMDLALAYNMAKPQDRSALIVQVSKQNPLHARYMQKVIAPRYSRACCDHRL